MQAMRILAAPLAVLALLLAATAPCAADPFAVKVGDARIGLDAPPGFADTGFTGSPRLQEMAETLTSASNRILLFALTDADLRRFMGGDRPEYKRYVIVATPRDLEREHVKPAVFQSFVGDSLRELGTAPAPTADYRKHLDANQGKPVLLAELRRSPEAVSVLQGIRLPTPPKSSIFEEDKPPAYALSTTTLMLVRGKALTVSVYGPYDGPADLDWIRSISARWVEALERLNSR